MSATGPQLNVGEVIPGTKYRVIKSLGAGGMGIVYQVVKAPNIGGVLKLMSSELTSHEEHRVRFFDEVRILAQLDHPNIVKVFDYDALPDGTPFYVMELLSGRTVRDVITTMGRVPPRVSYEITRQLLEALQCAHTHDVPVIHRDIKPENIFLHAPRHGEPVVKLIDFGVSAVADRTHDGAFVGTWSYAAPEQIRGDRPTPATDLYAAGLVLYEMLSGVGPFDHHLDWTKISEAQLKEIPAPVSKFAPWVPPSIVSLIASALAKDPLVRPRDAYAFAERLFELEWASDGKDPHDLTVEGPSPELAARLAQQHRQVQQQRDGMSAGAGASGAAAANAPVAAGLPFRRIRPDTPVEVTGDGPLSRVLSTVASAYPSSKNLAAARPAADRLGDVPLIGVPPESVRSGPTWRGVGGNNKHEPTSPDADALLAGLGAPAGKPPAKRESDPDFVAKSNGAHAEGAPQYGVTPNGTPRAGQVVIRAGRGASAPHEERAQTTPRNAALGAYGEHGGASSSSTLDEIDPSAPSRAAAAAPRISSDTFSSDARVLPRPRTTIFIVMGAALFAATLFVVVAIAVRGRSSTLTTTGSSGTQGTTNQTSNVSNPSATAATPTEITNATSGAAAGNSSSSAPPTKIDPLSPAPPTNTVPSLIHPPSLIYPTSTSAKSEPPRPTRSPSTRTPPSAVTPPATTAAATTTTTARPATTASGDFIRTF